MTIDLLPIKPQMAAILDLFFKETLKITNSFRNEFSIKNHVKMRYYIKHGTWWPFLILSKKACYALGKFWEFLQVTKEDILNTSLYAIFLYFKT